jgi:hypothetical protein
MTDDIIDFQKWRRKHEDSTKRKLDNILKIIEWSSDMQKRGLMPPEARTTARAEGVNGGR